MKIVTRRFRHLDQIAEDRFIRISFGQGDAEQTVGGSALVDGLPDQGTQTLVGCPVLVLGDQKDTVWSVVVVGFCQLVVQRIFPLHPEDEPKLDFGGRLLECTRDRRSGKRTVHLREPYQRLSDDTAHESIVVRQIQTLENVDKDAAVLAMRLAFQRSQESEGKQVAEIRRGCFRLALVLGQKFSPDLVSDNTGRELASPPDLEDGAEPTGLFKKQELVGESRVRQYAQASGGSGLPFSAARNPC